MTRTTVRNSNTRTMHLNRQLGRLISLISRLANQHRRRSTQAQRKHLLPHNLLIKHLTGLLRFLRNRFNSTILTRTNSRQGNRYRHLTKTDLPTARRVSTIRQVNRHIHLGQRHNSLTIRNRRIRRQLKRTRLNRYQDNVLLLIVYKDVGNNVSVVCVGDIHVNVRGKAHDKADHRVVIAFQRGDLSAAGPVACTTSNKISAVSTPPPRSTKPSTTQHNNFTVAVLSNHQ